MDRAFFPGGFGRPFFRPFPHPFFPGRFLFPFFFFSPFFPFFRDEKSNDMLFAQHQARPGDTLASIGHHYNMPYSMLEEANTHLANPNQLRPGEIVNVPRISHMVCHKSYMEMMGGGQQ